ncbi:MAG: YqeG family HAD IIIA-type phosphatase [Oscillospiraceae bacterium]|jgi:HAD superfamily phosphatase (TIGR01668 family)|nr:YqeG family HAD IIIA-type phosphatase [Oscillospiraceae bacterium]
MFKYPAPDLVIDSIYELDARLLTKLGVRLLLLDLDNTLAPYGGSRADETLRVWMQQLSEAGIEPFIFSNNRGKRPKSFAEFLGVGWIGNAKKPLTGAVEQLLEDKALSAAQVAIAGDQIFTDVLCGNRSGLFSILVRPLSLKNPFIRLRYRVERPFRKRAKTLKDFEE